MMMPVEDIALQWLSGILAIMAAILAFIRVPIAWHTRHERMGRFLLVLGVGCALLGYGGTRFAFTLYRASQHLDQQWNWFLASNITTGFFVLSIAGSALCLRVFLPTWRSTLMAWAIAIASTAAIVAPLV